MYLWSILSTKVEYTQHPNQTGRAIIVANCDQKTISKQLEDTTNIPNEEMQIHYNRIDKDEYLDKYPNVNNSLKFSLYYDDTKDVSTTYLGPERMTIKSSFKTVESFPIHANSHTWGYVLGGGMINILLDSGASKSYMSKAYYMNNANLHHLPKCTSSIKTVQVGNGHFVNTLFVIPIVVNIHGHLFEIFTLVSEIQPGIDFI